MTDDNYEQAARRLEQTATLRAIAQHAGSSQRDLADELVAMGAKLTTAVATYQAPRQL